MRKRSIRWLALVVFVGMAACSPGACAERVVEEAIEAETGGEADVDANSGTVTLRGEEGAVTFAGSDGGVELPDDFPDTIPVYPDALAIQYVSTGDGVQAGFRVDAAVGDVRDWYLEQLEDKGWEIQMNAVTPDGGMLAAELEGETLSLMMGSEENETTIIVTLAR